MECGSRGEESLATFIVKLDTVQGFPTYNVEITSQWTSSTVAASQEEGVFQVGIGRGELFRDLAVGEEHRLTVSNVYDERGEHATEFVAKIKTGNWDWPDGQEYSSGKNIMSVARRSCTVGTDSAEAGSTVVGASGGSTASLLVGVLVAVSASVALLL